MTMLMWTHHRLAKLALCFGAAVTLYLVAPGCSHNSNELAATVTGSTKKQDGEPCAKDSECINQCLTAAEAEKTPQLQPNTCGKTVRVNPT
jgi:hypothetical protein